MRVEEEAEHGPRLMYLYGNICFLCLLFPTQDQFFRLQGEAAAVVRFTPGWLSSENLQGCQSSCHSQRIAREGARLIDRPGGRDKAHDVSPSAVSGHRQPAADDLPEASEVGSNAVGGLRPAQRSAEAAHDFVEDEESPTLCRQLAQLF